MRFSAELQSANDAGRWVEVPEEIASSFPVRRPAVRGIVNGVPFRSRLAVYAGHSYLGFRAQIRTAAGISLGDVLDIQIEADDQPREVTVPEELANAFVARPDAEEVFATLAFTHRKEYADWIDEAKRVETRQRRAAKAVEMLTTGLRTPR